MPYNTAPIKPSDAITGSSNLPLARIKKIISMDEDIAACSQNAAFAISVATELFIRHLTLQAHNVVKSERKPRRNLQYRDFANAVSRIDNLEFLSDVIPQTTTYRKFKEKKARDAANGVATAPGQRTIDGSRPARTSDVVNDGGEDSSTSRVNGTVLPNGHATVASPTSPTYPTVVNGSPLVERTASHAHPSSEDVEMAD